MSSDQNPSNKPVQAYSSGSGGNNRQGLGQAFIMSMVRQIARSLGTLLVRVITGGRR